MSEDDPLVGHLLALSGGEISRISRRRFGMEVEFFKGELSLSVHSESAFSWSAPNGAGVCDASHGALRLDGGHAFLDFVGHQVESARIEDGMLTMRLSQGALLQFDISKPDTGEVVVVIEGSEMNRDGGVFLFGPR